MSTPLRPKEKKYYSDDIEDPMDDYAVKKQFLKYDCDSENFDPTPIRDRREGSYTTMNQFEDKIVSLR